ncbi:MAG: OadG family protein [Deltaproteobacteria bacterium]|nr:OadG family protein [Deltaproteobacteria bacterium]
MNKLNMSYDNIIAGNGIGISITGMLIVFSALILISLFISMLPKLLPALEKLFPEQHHHGAAVKKEEDHTPILAAIGYALYCKKTGTLPKK